MKNFQELAVISKLTVLHTVSPYLSFAA